MLFHQTFAIDPWHGGSDAAARPTHAHPRQSLWHACLGLLLLTGTAQAFDAFVGGDVRLESLSGNTWQVRAAVYEECESSPLPAPASSVNAVVPGSGLVPLSLLSNTDVTALCPGETSACSVPGGSTAGVRELIYAGAVTIPTPAPGSLLQVFLGGSPRRSTLTTLVDPGATGWLLGAEVVASETPRNSNPTFINPPYAVGTAGQPTSLSPAASDPDGDALQYELVDCFAGLTSTVNYAPGLDGQQPLATFSGVALNTNTGTVSFTASAAQTGQICLRAIEFRGGVQIGRTLRDIGFEARPATNTAPVLSPLSNAVATVGAEICRSAVASDADGDSLVLTASGSPLDDGNAFFLNTVNAPGVAEGDFCYTPVPDDIGNTYSVTFSVTDNACPTVGLATTAFNITVVAAAAPVEVPAISLPAMVVLSLGVAGTGLLSFRHVRRT